MSEDIRPLLSPNTDPQLLLESGPMQLRDFNPKGVLRFQGRKCMNLSCGMEIMDHWLRPNDDPDLRGEYWCSKEGNLFSMGITDCTVDIEGVSIPDSAVPTEIKPPNV